MPFVDDGNARCSIDQMLNWEAKYDLQLTKVLIGPPDVCDTNGEWYPHGICFPAMAIHAVYSFRKGDQPTLRDWHSLYQQRKEEVRQEGVCAIDKRYAATTSVSTYIISSSQKTMREELSLHRQYLAQVEYKKVHQNETLPLQVCIG